VRTGARLALGTLLLALHTAAPADAHPGHGVLRESLHRWTWEPVTIVALIASAVLYTIGLRRLWRRAGTGRGIARWQAAAFAIALASLAVALLSPVAWLSEQLFSAHMTQHEVLMLVSAPLLVFGHPLFAMMWALPGRWRERVARVIRGRRVAATWRTLTAPVFVFLLHGAALWVWHIPVLYEAALADAAIHALEHLSFVVTAALFWWSMVHGRYGRIGYGVAAVYVFLTAVHSSVLGALMTVAPSVLYGSYGPAASAWRLDPLEDQQLAGLLMWVPSGVLFIVLGLALFAAWLGESGRRVELGGTASAARAARLPR
jgi:cytochrome c oxidase assembly factor CtaG